MTEHNHVHATVRNCPRCGNEVLMRPEHHECMGCRNRDAAEREVREAGERR